MLILFLALAVFGWGWSLFGVIPLGVIGVAGTVLYLIAYGMRQRAN